MKHQLPTWADAQVIVKRKPFQVGVFPSTKPWDPRGRDRRFFAQVDLEMAEHGPHSGMALRAVAESGSRTSELDGYTLLGGEAEGHTDVFLKGAGDDWLLVVAADAWIAIGLTESMPYAIEVGPRTPSSPFRDAARDTRATSLIFSLPL